MVHVRRMPCECILRLLFSQLFVKFVFWLLDRILCVLQFQVYKSVN